jgi:energy-coupling factor transporter transmembrane protein EcfT
MHSEHLENVRPSWVAFGWFIGVAVMSAILFGLIAVGFVPRSGEIPLGWVLLAVFVGFLAGGYLTGIRVRAAPILHGMGIGLFSVLFWFVANLIAGEALNSAEWQVPPASAAGAVLFQIAAAAIGAHIATRAARAATAPNRSA